MTKKARIPEGLRKLFSNRARTFAETILSLIPPPSSATVQLRCTGSQPCLHCCSHGDRMSFLLREDDPSDYCELLNQCFVVVSDIAASPPYFHHHSRWSQLEVSLTHTHTQQVYFWINFDFIWKWKIEENSRLLSIYEMKYVFDYLKKKTQCCTWSRHYSIYLNQRIPLPLNAIIFF